MQLRLWHRVMIYGTLSAVALSGLLWFFLHDFIEEEPGVFQRALLILHGVSAFAVLVVFGSLFPVHMRVGWLQRRNLVSGLGLTSLMAILSITALVLYYGGEESRILARWSHIGLGVLGLAVLPLHVLLGHRTRQAVLGRSVRVENSDAAPPLSAGRGADGVQILAFRRKIRITRALRRSWLGAERTAFFRSLWRENR